MVYNKKYIQFNNLVFDTVSRTRDATYSASSKLYSSPYSYIHGTYTPFKSTHVLLNSATVSMTLMFNLKDIHCEERPLYLNFVKEELSRHGRLWAVQNHTLLWAWATLSNYREDNTPFKDYYSVDVSFTLYEGVWHKADWLRTFILPYDPCTFSDCFAIEEHDPCQNDCCSCNTDIADLCTCECNCVDEKDALCYNKDLIDKLYDCEPMYRVVYSCTSANKYFGSFLDNDHLGQKFCSMPGECQTTGMVVGSYNSRTDIPTSSVRIRIYAHDEMLNPRIEINGNANVIRGTYKGVLDIKPNGEVYNHPSPDCFCNTPLPVDVWEIPEGMDYGWVVHQGMNRVNIDIGTCCPFCVWIETDELTY